MDYIKRSVVVQKVMETKWESGSDGAAAMEIVAATPAADVAPVVHGRWIPFHSEIAGDMQYCSACEIGFGAKTDYCPNCGADMRALPEPPKENEYGKND